MNSQFLSFPITVQHIDAAQRLAVRRPKVSSGRRRRRDKHLENVIPLHQGGWPSGMPFQATDREFLTAS